MRHLFLALCVAGPVVLVGCGGGSTSGTPSNPPVTLTSVAVSSGAGSTVDLGFTGQFTATAKYSDGSARDVSSSATWSTADSSIATVSSAGVVSGKKAGSTTVQATWNSVSGSTAVTVAAPTTITVTGTNGDRPAGLTAQFSATATYADGSHDIGSVATWSTGDSTIASVAAGGLVTALKIGSTTIQAALGPTVGIANFVVEPPLAVSLSLSIDSTRVLVGTPQQLTVSATMTDHTVQDVTGSATLQFTNPYVVSVDAQGHVTALTDGLTSITAANAGLTSGSVQVQAYSKARFAVVPDASRIDSYYVDANTGRLRATTYVVRDNPQVQDICATPSIDRAYVIVSNYRTAGTASGSLSIYRVNPATGELSLLTDVPVPSGIGAGIYGPGCAAFHPSGKFFYVADETSGYVTEYSFDPSTGNAVALGNIAADMQPRSITMDPLGRFVYVSNAGSGDISGYVIDASTGALTPAPGFPMQSFTGEDIVSVDPRGGYAIVSANNTNQMNEYAIGADGKWTYVNGSRRTVMTAPSRLAFDPTGRYAYFAGSALDSNNNAQNVAEVDSFDPSTGGLTTASTTNLPAGILDAVSIDPEGKNAYFSDNFGGFYMYPIQADGTLGGSSSHFRAAVAINSVTPLAFIGGGAAVTASTTHLYAAVPADSAIAQFNFSEGQLTPMATAEVASGAVDSVSSGFFGRYVFAVAPRTLQPNMFEFTANASGSLSAVSNPYSLSLQVPELIIADRDGNFIYATDSFAPQRLQSFSRLASGILEGYSSLSALGHSTSLSLDPFTRFLLVANGDQNSISGYDLWSSTGAFSTNLWTATSYPAGTNPVAVYVEPLGRFAYTANKGSGDISQFRITYSPFGAANSIGANFAVSPNPTALAGDPLGKLLFVGSAGGDITAYAIDPGTGALSATVAGVTATGAVQAMTVDASGRYLIVGTSSGLFVYSFKSDGTLTLVPQSSLPAASSYVSLTTATTIQ